MNKNTTLLLSIADQLKDLDGPARHLLLTMASSVEGGCYSKIDITQARLTELTGIAPDTVRKGLKNLLSKQYLSELGGAKYINVFKLRSMAIGQHLPDRISYRKMA